MKLRIKKQFKCNIKNCTNLVSSKGAFCKSCIDKISNENYLIPICTYCNRVIDIVKVEKQHKNMNERIFLTICLNCYQKLEPEDETLF
ncbi:MAG: hypothetical protein N2321_00450 [Melioribacteraceae bacterium]|nr:hypothetical protein [Melioribacteraceae bacterium]